MISLTLLLPANAEMLDTIKFVVTYKGWGYQNLDRAGDTPIEGYIMTLDQTTPTTELEGWAVDPLMQTTASGVIIQIGDRFYETA